MLHVLFSEYSVNKISILDAQPVLHFLVRIGKLIVEFRSQYILFLSVTRRSQGNFFQITKDPNIQILNIRISLAELILVLVHQFGQRNLVSRSFMNHEL